jgi:hypothetical protein
METGTQWLEAIYWTTSWLQKAQFNMTTSTKMKGFIKGCKISHKLSL